MYNKTPTTKKVEIKRFPDFVGIPLQFYFLTVLFSRTYNNNICVFSHPS